MGQQSSGFDMSKLSTASKILLGGGVLLLLDSFILPWQKVCFDFGGVVSSACGKASMWGGDAGWAGLIAGLVVVALIIWEVMQVAGANVQVGLPASKLSAYLGFGVLGFVVVKFLLVMTNYMSFGAILGLIFALGVGYGAWMRFQEPVGGSATPPPPPPAGGDTSGFSG